jgi:streptogramin lyase
MIPIASKRQGIRRRIALLAVGLSLLTVVVVVRPGSAHAGGLAGVTDFPTPGADPWGTAFDSSGRVWVAMPGCDPSPTCPASTPPGKIGLFDPNTSSWVSVISLPAGYGQPLFVAVDPAGRVWFTMPVTNSIGVYDPAGASLSSWTSPTAGSGPWGLVIDQTGKPWFTEHYVNKIAAFDPTTHTFQEVATPSTSSFPYGITVDGANNIWFTENNDAVARIGEYTNQGVLNEYKIRSGSTVGSGLTPHLITIDHLGNVWWSEGWVHAVGKLNVASAQPGTNQGVTEYFYTPTCGGCGSHTSGIAADSRGQIWIDDSLQNTFGSIPVTGGAFTFYSSPSGHPHDGLNVDPQDRIWFDEEFGNRLAEAVQSNGSSSTTSLATTTTTLPGAPTVIAADTFQRPDQQLWGTASDGQPWGADANTKKVFSIGANAGRVVKTGSTSYSAVLGPSVSDSEVYVTGSLSSFTNSNFGAILRFTDGNHWYKAFPDGSNFVLQKKTGATTMTLATTRFAATTGTSYSIHFRAAGSALSATVWPSSAPEPGTWLLNANDTSLSSGAAGIRLVTQTGTATITSFQAVTRNAGTGTTTTAPTSTTSTSDSTTTSLDTTTSTASSGSTTTSTSTTIPSAGSPLGADNFQRPDQSHWGSASDGQMWGGDANTSPSFAISGNAGVVANTGSASLSAVLGPTATNAEVFVTASMSAFLSSNFGAVLRWSDANNWYKGYVDGTNLIIQKKVAGTATMIATMPFSAVAGIEYTLHFRVVASVLSLSVWPASGTEPASWMLSVSDSSLTSGLTGLRFLTQAWAARVSAFASYGL